MGFGLSRTMELWLWLLYFLPVSGTLKILPEVHLDGELGGSITIKCPLPEIYLRMYLCRQMVDPSICTTVVSNSFVKQEYKSRITLKPCFDKNIFLVNMTKLTENDNGVYACGLGTNTDLGKTQKVTVNVHNEYKPFWEDKPVSEPPRWFHRFLHEQMPSWFHEVAQATSSEFIAKAPEVTTPVPKTESPPVHQPSNTTPGTYHPRVSRTSFVAAAKSPDFLPSTKISKTSAQEGIRPLEASYSHHTRLGAEQRVLNHGSQSGMEDQEFHILIPSVLGLILIALLGLVIKRAIQKRKALSRRTGRQAVRMCAQGGSRGSGAQQPRPSQRPRSQNNVYSACPRRTPERDNAGPEEPRVPGTGASEPSAPPQILEASPSLKTSCEYVSLFYQPAANVEDTDSDDYINIPSLTHLPSCPAGPRPLC